MLARLYNAYLLQESASRNPGRRAMTPRTEEVFIPGNGMQTAASVDAQYHRSYWKGVIQPMELWEYSVLYLTIQSAMASLRLEKGNHYLIQIRSPLMVRKNRSVSALALGLL